MTDYLADEFGLVDENAFYQVVPDCPSVAVHKISPTAKHPFVTLFTSGMAESVEIHSSDGSEVSGCELYMQLRPDWLFDRVSLEKVENRWPIDYLRDLAHIPHRTGQWVDAPIGILENESGEAFFSPNCKYTGSFVFCEKRFTTSLNLQVQLYRVTPLFWEELKLVRESGFPSLLQAFDEASVPFIVSSDRLNVGRM